jgi:hypothetical protein
MTSSSMRLIFFLLCKTSDALLLLLLQLDGAKIDAKVDDPSPERNSAPGRGPRRCS